MAEEAGLTDKNPPKGKDGEDPKGEAPKKKPWVKPVLRVIRAGSAENSTRINAHDGGSGAMHKRS